LTAAALRTAPSESSRQALIAALASNLLWGAAPLLFMALGHAGATSWEIVAQRAMWSAPWAALLVLLARQGGQVKQVFRQPGTLGLLALSAVSIASGWALYVWAVNHGRNLDASLGYYINPLMNVAAGAVLFRERVGPIGLTAIALALAGVAIQTVALHHLPVISLVLATTFWIYGLIRRRVEVDAQAGLLIECLFMAGPGVAAVTWLGHSGQAIFGRDLGSSLLMTLVGPVTVAPLALFAWSARRLTFATVGFLQFLSPTVGFCIGVYTGEPLTPLRLLSFVFIWVGAAVFAYGAWRASRRIPGLPSLQSAA
jgi:chloramphenicol-sensitive protein RarD